MTTLLECQLARLRTTHDVRHRKWGVLENQLALKDLKFVPDQGEDAIARGDKQICWWWGRLILWRKQNNHSSATATSTLTNTSGRWDGTYILPIIIDTSNSTACGDLQYNQSCLLYAFYSQNKVLKMLQLKKN